MNPGFSSSHSPAGTYKYPNHNQNMDQDEDNFDEMMVRRYPTIKEFQEQVKQLKHENLQLKIRIFKCEGRSGSRVRSTNSGSILSSEAPSESDLNEITAQYRKDIETISKEKMQLEHRLLDSESKFKLSLNLEKENNSRHNMRLEAENGELKDRLYELERELSSIKLKQRDAELENCAFIAFGKLDSRESSPCGTPPRQHSLLLPIQPIPIPSTRIVSNKEIQTEQDFIDIESFRKLAEKYTQLRLARDKLMGQVDDLQKQMQKQVQSQVDKQNENELEMKNLKESHDDLAKSYEHSLKRISKLKEDRRVLLDRVELAETALKRLHSEQSRLVGDLKNLKRVCPLPLQNNNYHQYFDNNRENDMAVRSQDSSPDLGIDVQSDPQNNGSASEEILNCRKDNEELRRKNKDLSSKLRQTRLALDKTVEKLRSTKNQKEEVEKAICRQLHKTHGILKQVKQNLQNQEGSEAEVEEVD